MWLLRARLPGTIIWNSFGTIAPGASRSVNVTFTVLSQPASSVATNYASVVATDQFSHPVPGTQDTATVNVTRPLVSVSKVRHSGQDTTIQVGQPVGFDLTVTNSGDQTLTVVPLVDTFNATYLTYSTASVAESSTGVGTVTWNNVASLGSGGVLAPGASVTIVATFTAAAVPPTSITTDTASINGANVRDIHNDSTPSTSSASSIAITAPSVTVVKTRVVGQDPQIQVGRDGQLQAHRHQQRRHRACDDPAVRRVGRRGARLACLLAGRHVRCGNGQLDARSAGARRFHGRDAHAHGALGAGWPGHDGHRHGVAVRTSTATRHRAAARARACASPRPPSRSPSRSTRVRTRRFRWARRCAFDIAVTNTGDTALTTVPVTDTYDSAALTYTTATVAPTTAGAGTLSWNNIGALAVGQTTTVTVTFTAASVPAGQVTTDTAGVFTRPTCTATTRRT